MRQSMQWGGKGVKALFYYRHVGVAGGGDISIKDASFEAKRERGKGFLQTIGACGQRKLVMGVACTER